MEGTVMKRVMLRTLTLLTAVLCAQAMEQQPVDPKIELSAAIIACDATTFATSWKTFQESTPADELATMRTQLTQLATQLKNHKELERLLKLKTLKSRVLAGICAVPMAVLSIPSALFLAWSTLDDLYNQKIPIISSLTNRNYKTAFDDTMVIIALCMVTTYAGRYGLQDINYARYANTQELSAHIVSLDSILACLAPAATGTQEVQA
jgi:hypothetical protein